ncbi:hypothetical protein [Flocculibacter collagenilyticus]|uniref:hypothetical protein n=1 Tax=Flocculibacter collagenilyticus TaxID=2744479 RepID=UPI0018F43B55|nr:hypothetical protein [Flocculibacter collagenilyticus]
MKKLFIIMFLFFTAFLVYEEDLRFGLGYDFEVNDRITRHGKVVVEHKILDTRLDNGYLIGIRLPAHDIECRGGLVRALIDQPTYFILKLDETKVTSFLSKEEFESRISSLNIKFEDPLKYEFFGNIFKNAKRLDSDDKYSHCLRDNNLDGYRVAALF